MADPREPWLFPDLAPEGRSGVAAALPAETIVQLARRLPASIRLGTSSWSFPGWAGRVYARPYTTEQLAHEGLAAYARHPLFGAVGLDRTHYAPMAASDLALLRAAVPDGFRFLVKAHEACTLTRFPSHGRYGTRAGSINPHYLDPEYATSEVVRPVTEGLGPEAAVIVFQFARQGARLGSPGPFAERLCAFLRRLPPGPRYAVELRDRSLLGDDYRTALVQAGAVHCFNVHPAMPAVAEQAEALQGSPTSLLVIRWLLGGDLEYQEARARYAPFDRVVREDPVILADLADRCRRAAAAGHEVIVTVNNKAEGCAPLTVERLAAAIVDLC